MYACGPPGAQEGGRAPRGFRTQAHKVRATSDAFFAAHKTVAHGRQQQPVLAWLVADWPCASAAKACCTR